MKSNIRVLGIDDAPFDFRKDRETDLFGVVMRAPMYIEGIMHRRVSIDRNDATEVIGDMINRSRYRENIRAILLDGIAVGGFNVVDIRALHEVTGIGIVVFTRRMPDMEAIRRALKARFPDWQQRLNLMEQTDIHRVDMELGGRIHSCYIQVEGLHHSEGVAILKAFTHRAVIPEPIRVAHLIGAALRKGESHGHA